MSDPTPNPAHTLTMYTPAEMAQLSTLPQLIGTAMATAGSSGMLGMAKEMFATAQGMMVGLRDYATNAIVHAVLPNPKAMDPRAEMARAQQMAQEAKARIQAQGVDSAEKFQAYAIEQARAVGALLAKASPADAAGYRKWVLGIAEQVAQAASEGGFMGFGGERVSAPEKALLEKLREALGG